MSPYLVIVVTNPMKTISAHQDMPHITTCRCQNLCQQHKPLGAPVTDAQVSVIPYAVCAPCSPLPHAPRDTSSFLFPPLSVFIFAQCSICTPLYSAVLSYTLQAYRPLNFTVPPFVCSFTSVTPLEALVYPTPPVQPIPCTYIPMLLPP